MKVNEIEDLFNQYITENNKLYESADFKYEDFQDEPEEFDVKNLKIDNKTNYDIQSLNVHYNGDLYVIYFVPNFKRPYKYYEGPWKIAPHLYDGNGDFTIETGFFIYIDKLNTLIHENELIKNSLDFDEDDFIYCEIVYNILSEIKEHKNKYFKN